MSWEITRRGYTFNSVTFQTVTLHLFRIRRIRCSLLFNWHSSIIRSTPLSGPNIIKSFSNVRPSTRRQNVSSISMKLVCRQRSMSDAWRYAVWPDPGSRSRSRAIESRKFCHFQRLSPSPFIMGAGKWPRILKLGHNTYSLSGPDFWFLSKFYVSRDFEVGSK